MGGRKPRNGRPLPAPEPQHQGHTFNQVLLEDGEGIPFKPLPALRSRYAVLLYLRCWGAGAMLQVAAISL